MARPTQGISELGCYVGLAHGHRPPRADLSHEILKWDRQLTSKGFNGLGGLCCPDRGALTCVGFLEKGMMHSAHQGL